MTKKQIIQKIKAKCNFTDGDINTLFVPQYDASDIAEETMERLSLILASEYVQKYINSMDYVQPAIFVATVLKIDREKYIGMLNKHWPIRNILRRSETYPIVVLLMLAIQTDMVSHKNKLTNQVIRQLDKYVTILETPEDKADAEEQYIDFCVAQLELDFRNRDTNANVNTSVNASTMLFDDDVFWSKRTNDNEAWYTNKKFIASQDYRAIAQGAFVLFREAQAIFYANHFFDSTALMLYHHSLSLVKHIYATVDANDHEAVAEADVEPEASEATELAPAMVIDLKTAIPVAKKNGISIYTPLQTMLETSACHQFDENIVVYQKTIDSFLQYGFDEVRAKELAIVASTGRVISTAMCYYDDFSALNDSFDYAEQIMERMLAQQNAAEASKTHIENEADKRRYESEIEALKRQVKALQKENAALSHAAQKSQRENATLVEANEEQKSTIQELTETNNLLNEIIGSIEVNDDEKQNGNTIAFPYYTHKSIVLFGGHISFQTEMQKLLPELRIAPLLRTSIDPTPIKNADLVVVQPNYCRHPAYWAVKQAAQAAKVPLIHLRNAGAKPCAETIIQYLQRSR